MVSGAWVTLATNEAYANGALVLAASLRKVGTKFDSVILITKEVSESPLNEVLQQMFTKVQLVNVLDSQDSANLALLKRPELGVTLTKLHCWTLTEYQKCVFLDADTLVLTNCDELFEREELSAAPDLGWPDCFNSGVFVFVPSNETYKKLLNHAVEHGSFDGADQGLLNMFFSDWATKDIHKHLPYTYNMAASVAYSHLAAFQRYKNQVKIVHFLGQQKPWHAVFDVNTNEVFSTHQAHLIPYIQQWWIIFKEDIMPRMKNPSAFIPVLGSLAGDLASMNISLGSLTSEQLADLDRKRQEAWEMGAINYKGSDSFENIQRRLDETIARTASGPSSSKH